MELSTFDRITLLNVLADFHGDFLTLKIVRELKESLSFDEEEHRALGLKIEDGQAFWLSEADKPKDVPIGEKAAEIIRTLLLELDQKKMLTEDHYSLYERFIGG
jgi:hypothetical protein